MQMYFCSCWFAETRGVLKKLWGLLDGHFSGERKYSRDLVDLQLIILARKKGCFCQSINWTYVELNWTLCSPWMYFSGNLFPALCTANVYLYPPLFLLANENRSLHMLSDCQPISSAQSSPVCAWDCSQSSFAIQLSCWTQAFISPTILHVPLISLPLPFSSRALFCRLLVYICSICNVIHGTSTVKNRAILVIPF